MCAEPNAIDVYESRRFTKALAKLPEAKLKLVEDQIDLIIADPLLGEQKKGALSHVRVHKFKLHDQLALLGYSWVENKLELYLLQFGPHENFYRDLHNQRKQDLGLHES